MFQWGKKGWSMYMVSHLVFFGKDILSFARHKDFRTSNGLYLHLCETIYVYCMFRFSYNKYNYLYDTNVFNYFYIYRF